MEHKLNKIAKLPIGKVDMPQKAYDLRCWGGAFNDGPVDGIEEGEYMSLDKSLIDDLEKNLNEHAKDTLIVRRFETYAPMNKFIAYIVEVKFNDGADNEMACIMNPLPQDLDIDTAMYEVETIDLLQYLQKDYLKRVQSIKIIHAYAVGAFDLQHISYHGKGVYAESDVSDYLNG